VDTDSPPEIVDAQRRALTLLDTYRAVLAGVPELESVVGVGTPDPVNAFLKEHGFQIKLGPFEDPRNIGVASVLTCLGKWAREGSVEGFWSDRLDRAVVTAQIFSGNGAVEFFRHPGLPEIVLRLATTGTDVVYLTMYEGADPLDVPDAFRDGRSERVDSHEETVQIPMVALDTSPDLSWLLGVRGDATRGTLIGKVAKMLQGIEQHVFRLNHVGYLANCAAAVELGLESGARPTLYRVNRPFVLWIERPGLGLPLFTAYCCEDVWKDPGSLE
jgi:hypothetical protein